MSQQLKALSSQEKRNILEKVDKYVGPGVSLASDLGISVTTLISIIIDRESIEESPMQCVFMPKENMYTLLSKHDQMQKILGRWFVEARFNNLPISDKSIRDKALYLASKLNIEGFTASDHWIDSFRKWNSEIYKLLCEESLL